MIMVIIINNLPLPSPPTVSMIGLSFSFSSPDTFAIVLAFSPKYLIGRRAVEVKVLSPAWTLSPRCFI